MAIARGTRLGTFEILDLVGAGGMGEVYRARDTRLERTVAVKVLPPLWADSPDMRQRFEREAQTIASLNHPNICTLHDIGRHEDPTSTSPAIDFLVMEFLEGETLAQRLERGPLALDDALRIAIAIADALDKAHRKGVTHRDLKPGNIFLVRAGGASDPPRAKLLDFGLAKLKLSRSSGSGAVLAASATPTDPQLTAHGAILGTLQYMAPEQLEGLEADARTDIFAFGVVLHEMITGRKTFEGKSRVLLMSAIATAEPPPLSTAQPAVSPALDHVVKTCLAKDPAERWQTARDVLAELQWIAAGGDDALAPTPTSSVREPWNRLLLAALAAAAVVVAVSSALLAFYRQRPGAPEEMRFRVPIQLSAQPTQIFLGTIAFDSANFAVSPDGRTIAFVARATPQEPWAIFVRPLGSVTPRKLPDTDEATLPFWSADGRAIAFVARGKLRRVDASGGPPQDICDVASFGGGDWNAEGAIIFGTSQGLFRVSAEGGKPEPLTTLDAKESGHFWPHFLPDGRRYLYLSWASSETDRAIFAGALDSKERTRVTAAGSKALYAEPGYLLYQREEAVYAQRFDEGRLSVSGEPVRLADEVTSNGTEGEGDFDVSTTGVLVYHRTTGGQGLVGPQSDDANWQLRWISREGRDLETAGPYGPYRGFEVSPDGRRVAVHRHESNGGDIVVLEPRGSVLNLTFDASRHNSTPIWSPDGSRIVYASLQKGKWGLYETLSNGAGTEQLLYESDLPKAPMSWSPDGKRLVFWVQDPKTAGDVWVLTREDSSSTPSTSSGPTGSGQAKDPGGWKAAPLIDTTANESHPQVSRDGKWIAYTSNSTGRNEIYVKPFPTGNGVYKISVNGGDWARWNPNTKELFFRALGNGAFVGNILAASVSVSGVAFENFDPKPVVQTVGLNLAHSSDYQMYDISPDGQRLLILQFVNTLINPTAVGTTGPDPEFGLIVALNWTTTLEKQGR
jgi:serine/threonine protein kinase/Tol biopolymer transport system component